MSAAAPAVVTAWAGARFASLRCWVVSRCG